MVRPGDAHGWLAAGYATESLGVSTRDRVWWRCLCQEPNHVTYKAPRSVNEKRKGSERGSALWCHRCDGPRPSNSIAPTLTMEEQRAWQLLAHHHPNVVFAVHVQPWMGCVLAVDIYMPQKKLIIEVDGRSHFEAPLPHDRKSGKGGKWAKDRAWDQTAGQEGFKVLRLHYKDESLWLDHIKIALEAWEQKNPMYTPSYAGVHGAGPTPPGSTCT